LQRRKNANLTLARTVEFVENLWKMRIINVNVYMDTEAKIVKVDCLNIASNECKEPEVVASLGQLIISSECNFVPLSFSRGD